MDNIISIQNVSKTYDNGFVALKNVNLDIKRGEILALLGPNGAGKTTLISAITGIVTTSGGSISVDGNDTVKEFREARKRIGLVPQELTIGAFETVWNTVRFSRGLFGKPYEPEQIESLLAELSLADKKDNQLRMLSGGMKRRVLIAKALSHEPEILFLDEPTAGVDVELRKDMWQTISKLRDRGVTIILTTHYIEEAEEIADRIAVINAGEILLIEEKAKLMQQLGKKQLIIELKEQADQLPTKLKKLPLELSSDGLSLTYTYDINADASGITSLLQDLKEEGLQMKDLQTTQSSLEEIFVDLVSRKGGAQS
ncbi:ABC transporter ATP-binding protein [Arenicella sp. 4NH20-0111]|uniref:ABC transporter ATP-binding protein n=1 Tax=Arenicella sp. 4NH20-0111 TaxID=3127648 RepID=UPI00310810F0